MGILISSSDVSYEKGCHAYFISHREGHSTVQIVTGEGAMLI